ncbi:hypothetical protein JCM19240_1186 [Vibrio maritimus]|uniref:Uncharacterized protein n=1 Tax=Vibrio maritimus TaxID=990268 RepID=A0A090T4W2_9VIBR|nr:hypothetical protein JCM19240_1186 [Vibrio maritimus]
MRLRLAKQARRIAIFPVLPNHGSQRFSVVVKFMFNPLNLVY